MDRVTASTFAGLVLPPARHRLHAVRLPEGFADSRNSNLRVVACKLAAVPEEAVQTNHVGVCGLYRGGVEGRIVEKTTEIEDLWNLPGEALQGIFRRH